jgi:hypothetical protein
MEKRRHASLHGLPRDPRSNAPGELRPTHDDCEEAEKSLLGGPSAPLGCWTETLGGNSTEPATHNGRTPHDFRIRIRLCTPAEHASSSII